MAETASRSRGRAASDPQRKLRELSFLHEFAQLTTTARTWDELMRTIVDRTITALDVQVCSVYLLDRDGERLRLAATNGLDRDQIGKVTMGMGEGLTGRAAQERAPVASPDVRIDPRFKWVPGFDQSQFTSMLSVPMPWNDQIIGVLNVQTVDSRVFTPEEVEFLVTIAALLGGIVEKGRLQIEAQAQLETLTALDGARAELLAVVTHELRTPLSVVRAYLDLLADGAMDPERPDPDQVVEWRDLAAGQVTRLDRLVDSILASIRGEGLAAALTREPFDVAAAVSATIEEMKPLLRGHELRGPAAEPAAQDASAGTRAAAAPAGRAAAAFMAFGDEGRFRQVLEHLLENEVKHAPSGEPVSVGMWRRDGEIQVYVTDDGPGIPESEWSSVFEAYVRTSNRPRGSGIGLYAARRLMGAMGGRIWLEANGFGGSRFVIALPEVPPQTGIAAGTMAELGVDGSPGTEA